MVIPGRGLFTFKSDYSYSDTANTITARESEYLCIGDKYYSQVDIYGYNDADDQNDHMMQSNVIDLGSWTALRAEFYYADGALRVADGSFNSNNTTKWFGRIGDTTKKKLLGVELDTEWVSLDNTFDFQTTQLPSVNRTEQIARASQYGDPRMQAAQAKGYDPRMGRTYQENIQAMGDPRMRGAKGGLAKILGV